jgi:heptosyltransferase I
VTDSSSLAGKRIAIIRMSAIGDVVHVLPIVSSLKAAAPDSHIAWLIQPTPYELVRHHKGVDEFILFERKPLIRSLGKLREQLRDRAFDVVLGLHTSLKAGLATSMFRAPRKIGFDRARAPELNWLFTNERIPARPRGHMQDEAIEFLDYLGIPLQMEWGIGSTAEERVAYEPLLPHWDAPTVALVVASSDPAKDWPVERYAALGERVQEDLGARVIIVGGRTPAELSAARRLRELMKNPPLDLGAWDLRRLVYLIERSDVLVSPDSGPLHIGVAVGTPSVALMGYTNPRRVGPYVFRDLMIDAFGEPGESYSASDKPRDGRMSSITVDQVFDRVVEGLKQSEDRAGR